MCFVAVKKFSRCQHDQSKNDERCYQQQMLLFVLVVAHGASLPLTLWCRARCKPYFFCDLPWNCRWYSCFQNRLVNLLLNKKYLNVIVKLSLFSCYLLISEHFSEYRMMPQCTVAIFWCNKVCAFFLDHLKHNIFFQNNSFFMGNKIDTGMQEQ